MSTVLKLDSDPNIEFETKRLKEYVGLAYLEQFCRSEGQVRHVRHPNICPSLVGFFEQTPQPMPILVFRRSNDKSLSQLIDDANFPISLRLSCLLDTLHGLKYLHNGVYIRGKPAVHGNISPSEIMVAKTDGHAYLKGFGASKYLNSYCPMVLEGWDHEIPVTEPPGDIRLLGYTMIQVRSRRHFSRKAKWWQTFHHLIREIKPGMRPAKPETWTIDDALWDFIVDSCLTVDPAKRITAANAIPKMEEFVMHYQIRGEFRDWPFPDLTHLRLNNRLPNPDSKLKFLRRLSELVVSNFAGCLRI